MSEDSFVPAPREPRFSGRVLLLKLLRLLLLIILGTSVLVAIAMPDYVRAQAWASPTSPAEWLLFQPFELSSEEWESGPHADHGLFFASADGTLLHGAWFPAEDSQGVVVFAHGNAGHLQHRTYRAELLRDRFQLSVLLFDYRGYGLSEGTATVEGTLADTRAARTEAAKLAQIPEAEVILMGRSLGGALVAEVASEAEPRGLIIESSFRSLQEICRVHFPRLTWLVSADKLNSTAALQGYRGPLLLSHGDADATIPFSHGQALFQAAAGPKKFVRIPGGDHNDSQSEAYWEELGRFLEGLSAAR